MKLLKKFVEKLMVAVTEEKIVIRKGKCNMSHNIEDYFMDDESEQIWKNLMLLYKTSKYKYLIKAHEICGAISDSAYLQRQYFHDMIKQGKKLILYGLGGGEAEFDILMAKNRKDTPGYLYYPFITDIEWECCCDRRYHEYKETGFLGKRVISPEKLVNEYGDAIVVVGATAIFEEIKNDLTEKGFPEQNIECFRYAATACYEEKQYFDDFIKPAKESVFIDGGCYRADSIEAFIKWNKHFDYDKIISFEPDLENYKLCQEIIKQNSWKNVEILNCGLGASKKTLRFMGNGDDTSLFSKDGDEKIEINSIDAIAGNSKVSFIKLDVEGYELEALKGAKETIRNCIPRMAVCLYHKKEDIFQIPEYILKLWDGYRFYLRIYSNAYCEVVLYAVPLTNS